MTVVSFTSLFLLIWVWFNLLVLVHLEVINNVSLFTVYFTAPTNTPQVPDMAEPLTNKLFIEDVISLVIYPSVSNNTSSL